MAFHYLSIPSPVYAVADDAAAASQSPKRIVRLVGRVGRRIRRACLLRLLLLLLLHRKRLLQLLLDSQYRWLIDTNNNARFCEIHAETNPCNDEPDTVELSHDVSRSRNIRILDEAVATILGSVVGERGKFHAHNDSKRLHELRYVVRKMVGSPDAENDDANVRGKDSRFELACIIRFVSQHDVSTRMRHFVVKLIVKTTILVAPCFQCLAPAVLVAAAGSADAAALAAAVSTSSPSQDDDGAE